MAPEAFIDTSDLGPLVGSRRLPRIEAVVHRQPQDDGVGGSIHSDAAAADWGFESALVPGIRIYEAALRPVVELLGEQWFRRGVGQMRHRAPAYEKSDLTVEFAEGEDSGRDLLMTVRNEAAEAVAVGWLRVDTRRGTAPPDTPVRREPLPSFDAYPGTLVPGHPMVTGPVVVNADWLAEMGLEVPDDLAEGAPVEVPSLAQRFSTSANFETYEHVTPGIHYAGETHHFDPIRLGDTVENRGEIVSVYERNGRHYFDSRHAVLTARGVAAIVKQTVIYYQERRS